MRRGWMPRRSTRDQPDAVGEGGQITPPRTGQCIAHNEVTARGAEATIDHEVVDKAEILACETLGIAPAAIRASDSARRRETALQERRGDIGVAGERPA